MRGDRADGEQERVARQEGDRDQPGLGEDDQEQDDVQPVTGLVRQRVHGLGAEVDERLDERLQEIHRAWFLGQWVFTGVVARAVDVPAAAASVRGRTGSRTLAIPAPSQTERTSARSW